jgi:two-component system chemotaxis response regulator CheB
MQRDLIAIGGSAGSLDTLLSIAAAMPADFSGSLFIVAHIGHSPSQLPGLLSRVGRLPASHPRDREPVRPGQIYVAPPDRHLLVGKDMLRLSRGPREHFTRPAIDPLFRSAAAAYGPRVIGVVLSGGGSDGGAGLDTIKRAGGLAVVLEPGEAIFPDMPRAAAEIVAADYVVPAGEIPDLLVRLSREAAPSARASRPQEPAEPTQVIERPYALTCPECGGALRTAANGAGLQYRCHIGHIFGAAEMLPAQLETLEKALDVAQRVLNERIELARSMIAHATAGGRSHGIRYWQKLQAEAEGHVAAIRRILANAAEEDDRSLDAPTAAGK